jgi:hypothetical protein
MLRWRKSTYLRVDAQSADGVPLREWDDFWVEAISGGEQALEALTGDVRGWDARRGV